MKNAWYKGKRILQDGKYSGHKTILFQCTYNTLCIQVDKLYVSMNTANPFTWVWEADPLIQQPWFIRFHCTRMTLSVQICFFSTYEKWYCIKANAELQTDFPSLPKPVCVVCKSNNNKDSKVYYSASLDFPVLFCAPYRYSSELRAEAT